MTPRPALTSLLLAALPIALPAQGRQMALTSSDSALVGRILAAEDARDSTSRAFAEAAASVNERVRLLGKRALARIRDPRFTARDSPPAPAAPPHYEEPAWRLRYRELGTNGVDCSVVERDLHDPERIVIMRAIDILSPICASDADRRQLHDWAMSVPRSSQRRRGGVAWQIQAHALVTYARLLPNEARPRVAAFASSPVPAVRVYAARAASVLRDVPTLHLLARDANDNVKEAAIEALRVVAQHDADDDYLAALGSTGYQAVRAAAVALRGSSRSDDLFKAALASLARMRRDSSETSRDARLAVLERLGEVARGHERDVVPFAEDFDCDVARAAARIANVQPRCQPIARTLPPDAVHLALGESVMLRVTLADSSGGGSFVVRLRGDVAPIAAARVLDLARSGFYNNSSWYRVEPDFVIQGGGPGHNEYVGYPRFIRDELSALPQVRGTVGMSTRGHDTGDGQWFINLRDNLRLTRDYTTFAEVVSGIDVVDQILEGDVIARIEVVTP